MAKFSGWKKRYSYLDDYKKGIDGQYVYYGRHYILKGGSSFVRTYKWTLGLSDILLLALFIIAGCTDAGAIWRMWYVLAPYAVEAAAVLVFLWKTVSLITEKFPLKAYIYKKTVPWYRPCAYVFAAASALSAIGSLICMLTLPEATNTAGCILYIVLEVVAAASAVLFAVIVKKYCFEEDPSEVSE